MRDYIGKHGRVCFLHEEHEVPYPVFKTENEDGTPVQVVTQAFENGQHKIDCRESSVDDVYEWLIEMDYVFPDVPSFKILQTYLAKICPESLIDPIATQYFRLESAIQSYGLEVLNMDYKTFEFLESVRAAENTFENLLNFEREAAANAKGKH